MFRQMTSLYVEIILSYIGIRNKQWKKIKYSDTSIFGDFSNGTCIVFFLLISILFTNSSGYKIKEHDESFPMVPHLTYVGTISGDLLELASHTRLSK